MPRTKQRTGELRDHVLSVAVDVLAADGVAGFTTRSIARESGTSTPAVYELFGDKAGLVREVFFEGFRLLRRYLDDLQGSGDPRADLVALAQIYRRFIMENPGLSEVMFSRPFTDFDAGRSEEKASSSVRIFIVGRVGAAVDAGVLRGDPTDVAHIFVALVQGLAAAEKARRLGTSAASVDRRWDLALDAVLNGLNP
jgi:AcrR family transcriptional regulator